jgi:hypothetical protein
MLRNQVFGHSAEHFTNYRAEVDQSFLENLRALVHAGDTPLGDDLKSTTVDLQPSNHSLLAGYQKNTRAAIDRE